MRHGCDYDFDGKTVQYYYNFISYTWILDGRALYVKTYLDEIEKVFVTVPDGTYGHILAFADVLRFLPRL